MPEMDQITWLEVCLYGTTLQTPNSQSETSFPTVYDLLMTPFGVVPLTGGVGAIEW